MFAILPNSKDFINNCIKSGLNDYMEEERFSKKCLLCRLERLLILTDENILEVYSRGNIYLNPEKQIAYISGMKLKLTYSETRILKYLINKDNPCTLRELSTYLGSTIQDKSIRVIVYRLEKKMRYILGYSVIKNMYKRGYYIDY